MFCFLLQDVSGAVSPQSTISFNLNFFQLWMASPFPLCTPLWEKTCPATAHSGITLIFFSSLNAVTVWRMELCNNYSFNETLAGQFTSNVMETIRLDASENPRGTLCCLFPWDKCILQHVYRNPCTVDKCSKFNHGHFFSFIVSLILHIKKLPETCCSS